MFSGRRGSLRWEQMGYYTPCLANVKPDVPNAGGGGVGERVHWERIG